MHLVVLGGTVFLSRAVAVEALARGHRVTCVSRGVSGDVPAGAAHLRWDRAEAAPAEVAALAPDAVVDVAKLPSHVRRAVAALPDAHWVFVSTVSVYADTSRPGGTVEDSATLEPVVEDLDPRSSPEAYGAMKVACEALVRDGAASATVVRPGLIVGPGDPTGRFTAWPVRAELAHADGEGLLLPGDPEDLVQVIDVRDLASWLVDLAESHTSGTFDAVCPPLARAGFVAALGAAVGGVHPRWVPSATLLEAGVPEWNGPGALTVWVGSPGTDGFLARDPGTALEAGLRPRPLAHTAADTLAWVHDTPDAPVAGLTRDEERALLARHGW